MSKVVAIIQARTASTRLPKKVLSNLAGHPMLWHVIERAKRCQTVEAIVVATTPEDSEIFEIAESCGVESFAGSHHNVLDRYYQAAKQASSTFIIRMTADCPLMHPPTIDNMVRCCQKERADYVCLDPTVPTMETGAEVVTFAALKKMLHLATTDAQREHVTLFIKENPHLYRIKLSPPTFARKDVRLTVDEEDDYKLMCEVYNALYKENQIIALEDVFTFLDAHPEIKHINAHVQMSVINRYAGKLWEKIGEMLEKWD